MSINLPRAGAKEVIDSIDRLLRLIMFPHAKPLEISTMQSHLQWLRSLNDFDSQCQLQTIPETQTTRIIIEITPATNRQGSVRQ